MLRYPPPPQRGLTMVELLIAMALALLVALAAMATLLVAQQGFAQVDAATQLRENARFAQDTLQRIGVQTGFKSFQFAVDHASSTDMPPPNVFGIDNASRTKTTTWDRGTTRSASSLGYGSDILVLRFQPSTLSVADGTGNFPLDGSMIDCLGVTPTDSPMQRHDRVVSIFHVQAGSDGEPALMCSRSSDGTGPFDPQPLVQGVENFQVLYGVDGIGPGNTTTPIPESTADTLAERYLRANQLTVSNENATYANWQRVRSIRVGMVLRGPPGSAIDNSPTTFYPLGSLGSSAGGAAGSAFASSSDPGTTFSPTPDGRLRQVVTFTIHLRNHQGAL